MSAYVDSSLLLKLYVREPNSPNAIAAVQGAEQPLFFTLLHKLEILGAIRSSAKRGSISPRSASQAVRLLRKDLQTGVYALPLVDWHHVFERANHLSRRHSRSFLVRSLDLLHVALALELGAAEFLSYDDRQRKAAAAEGLKVLP